MVMVVVLNPAGIPCFSTWFAAREDLKVLCITFGVMHTSSLPKGVDVNLLECRDCWQVQFSVMKSCPSTLERIKEDRTGSMRSTKASECDNMLLHHDV